MRLALTMEQYWTLLLYGEMTMNYGEFKAACEASGLTDTDNIWFIDCHPTEGQTHVLLTPHDVHGYSITDPPIPMTMGQIVVSDDAMVAPVADTLLGLATEGETGAPPLREMPASDDLVDHEPKAPEDTPRTTHDLFPS